MSITKKIEYLQMIQEIIARMSTISTVIKGFVITFVVAICAIIVENGINIFLYFIFALALFCLMYLDIYYLQLERKYRYLYELVRTEQKEIDFSLKLTEDLFNDKSSSCNIICCIKSVSFFIFYLPILIIYLLFWFIEI